MVKLEGVVMILELHRQGLSVSEIARRSGLDRKTVRRYVERGLEPPTYGPRKPRPTLLDPFTSYLRERVRIYPGLTGARLLRERRERGYEGATPSLGTVLILVPRVGKFYNADRRLFSYCSNPLKKLASYHWHD